MRASSGVNGQWDTATCTITPLLPGADFTAQRRQIGNAPVEALAGEDTFCSGSNVQALAENFNTPVDVATDRLGRTYITDSTCNRVVMVDSTGVVSVTVGTGFAGYTGDGGSATQAMLHYPNSIAVDSNLTVSIADTSNNVIRKVDGTGKMTIVAGVPGSAAYNGDNITATSTYLNGPTGVAADSQGNMFITD